MPGCRGAVGGDAARAAEACRRVPRDRCRLTAADWAPAALALTPDAAILPGDDNFLGRGCPTRTVETLRSELGSLEPTSELRERVRDAHLPPMPVLSAYTYGYT